jgi:hypothetical protein
VADNVTYQTAVTATPPNATTVATDEVAVGGTQPTGQVQFVKLVDGTLNGTTPIPGSAAGIKVDLSSTAANATAIKVDGSAVTQPVSFTTPFGVTQSGTWTVQQGGAPWSVSASGAFPVTDNAGSLTVDAPVGTPVFVRLSDGTSPITTLPVSFTTPISVTQSGTWTVQQGGAPWSVTSTGTDNISQWGGAATSLGQKVATSSVPVVLASDQPAISAAVTGSVGILQGGNIAAVKAASTAPAAADPALVVSISPNSTLSVSAGAMQATDETSATVLVRTSKQNTTPALLIQDEFQQQQLDTIILLLQEIAMNTRMIAADTVSGRGNTGTAHQDAFQGAY